MGTIEITIAIVGLIILLVLSFFAGSKMGSKGGSAEKVLSLQDRISELLQKNGALEQTSRDQTTKITELTSDRDVQRTNYENAERKLKESVEAHKSQLLDQKQVFERQINSVKEEAEKNKKEIEERFNKSISEIKESYETQLKEMRNSFDKQLSQTKEDSDKQLAAIKEMNSKQVEDQLALIKEQMRTTSENVLKERQKELGEQNQEQVSKIIDPLQKSLKDMEDALNKTKEQQHEALTRLDQTIKENMENSVNLGKTADRLTKALTGEVKVQGNFGELKLKQLLEDLELKEGEQFDTQETLRDSNGKVLRGDDGKGLIPDFILHFPNNRHVVVDSKMSLTDYERYMNSEDGSPEKGEYMKAHIESVRSQVKRLAKKEYTKYLPNGYNRLNFAIMYIPIEGALNLALFNDATLWRDAYDQGVMILGPQTMYMNLRVLEMMWTQVKQLENQQNMMDAANTIIDRVQDFGMRFMDVEASMQDTFKKMTKLKITTSDSGQSIITAAKNLLKAGAKENKKKKTLSDMGESMFIDSDHTQILSLDANEGSANDPDSDEIYDK